MNPESDMIPIGIIFILGKVLANTLGYTLAALLIVGCGRLIIKFLRKGTPVKSSTKSKYLALLSAVPWVGTVVLLYLGMAKISIKSIVGYMIISAFLYYVMNFYTDFSKQMHRAKIEEELYSDSLYKEDSMEYR